MSFANTRFSSRGTDQMKFSLIILGLSSLLGLVSSMGAIGALGALNRSMLESKARQLEQQVTPEQAAIADTIQVTETMVFNGSLAMLCWCVIGSLIGAWTYVVIMPVKSATPARLAAMLVSAAGCGVTLTPLVLYYGGLPKDPNLIGGIATLVALLSIGVLVDLVPAAAARIKAWLLGRLPGGDS